MMSPLKDWGLSSGEREVGTALSAIEQSHVERYRVAIEMAQGMSRPPRRIMDLFCGVGYGTQMLARAFPDARLYGADGCKDAIAFAGEHWKSDNCSFDWQLWPEMMFPEEWYELVVSLESLEHVTKGEEFVRDLWRSLRPHGRLVLSTPDADTWPVQGHRFHRRHYREADLLAVFDEICRSHKLIDLRRQQHPSDPAKRFILCCVEKGGSGA